MASAMAAAVAEAEAAEADAKIDTAGADEAPAKAKAKSRPSLPLKTRISVALLSHLTDSARRSDGSINRRLLRVIDFTSPANPSPIRGVSSSDVTVDPSRSLWFRIYNPSSAPGSGPLPVVVFFHGGGFSFLSAASRSYDAICRRLSRKLPAIIVSVNYRLSPEHRCPAPYDDGFDVLRYLDEHPTELPREADLGRCFLAGDSAGGNIVHHVAVRTCGSRFERVKIRGIVPIQPFFGGEERTESELAMKGAAIVSMERTDLCWKGFLPEGEDRDHWAVNVCGKNAVDVSGLEGFPATLVITAAYDPLRDWQKRYYEWLKRSGKEVEMVHYPNTIHAFYIFPELPESGELISVVKNFVDRLT